MGSRPIARSQMPKGIFYLNIFVDKEIGAHYNGLCFRRRGQVGRQGSAKPSSRVQIPSSPQKKTGYPVFLFFPVLNFMFGDSIRLLVIRISGMPFDPAPNDLMLRNFL